MSKIIRLQKNRPNSWEEALEQFLWLKQAQGLSSTTVTDYRNDIAQFFRHNPKAYMPPFSQLKPLALAYMAEDIKPATFNLRLTYLRAFFDWCVSEGIFDENPLIGIKRRKAEERIVDIPKEALIELINAPNRSTFSGLRDYALIVLTLDTGIRPKEAFAVLPNDVNLRSLEVYIRSEVAKTRTSRTLPISPVTVQAIKCLLNARHPKWNDGVPVFSTADGGTMNHFTWGDRLEMYSKRLGVKIRPYDLRHCFALEYLRNGGNALSLQRVMGHADLSMTKRYVALTQDDLREQHATASPLNSLIPQKHRVRKI